MAKQSSSAFAILLIDGYNLLGASVQAVTHTIKALLEKTTGLGDSWEKLTPTGLAQATLTQTGAFFEDSVNGMHAALSTSVTAARQLVFAVAGNGFGGRFTGAEGTLELSYDVLGQNPNLTKANVTYALSGQIDRGLIIQPWTQKTVTWNTFTDGFPVDYTADTAQRVIPITSNTIANPTVVTTPVPHGLTTNDVILISGVATSSPTINGSQTVTVISPTTFSVPVNVTVGGTGGTFVRANTSAGGWGYLQVSEMTGPSAIVGKIRSSADNITYADAVVFTSVAAAPAAQRVSVAGVVARYLCFSGTITGAGTVTVFAGFARN